MTPRPTLPDHLCIADVERDAAATDPMRGTAAPPTPKPREEPSR
jgi:hypothetical protein